MRTASELLHTVLSVIEGAATPVTFPVADDPPPGSSPPSGSLPPSGSSPESSLWISTSDIDIVPVYAEFELYWNIISFTAPVSSTSNANLHGPLQRARSLFRVGDDGDEQVRDAVVGRKLDHLRVDHDKAHLFGR